MKRLAFFATVLAVAAVPAVVQAVALHNGTPLDHQRAKIRDTAATTSSTRWMPVPGLDQLDICAIGQVTATISVVESGGTADFRLQFDGGPTMGPAFARFDPHGATSSFSFSFAAKMGRFEGSDGHLFTVQWRSPGGVATTLKRGDLNLLFRRGSC
jgi:hypothetical protein